MTMMVPDRILRLERQVKVLRAFGLIVGLSSAVLLFTAFQTASGWHLRNDVIKTRQLAIVDDKGTPRLLLGAPLPDPVSQGKVQKRRSPANGILLIDSNGNETGGLAMLDDGSVNFCFDDTKLGQEALCMYVSADPKFGRGIMLKDGATGQARAWVHIKADNVVRLELLDAAGHSIWSQTAPSQSSR